MLKSFYKLTTLGVLTGLLFAMFAVAPVTAQEQEQAVQEQEQAATATPGTDRETAGPNFEEAITISSGERHWYRFRYVFDEEIDSEPGNAVVSLEMDRAGCASFEVTTSGRLNFPIDDEGELIGPVGRGTPFNTGDDTIPTSLIWVGSGEVTESYFVIVRQHGDSPCSYTLSITGSPVVF